MVKINKTLGLALLTALAASCSSDNDVAQSNPTVENNNGVAYATLRIELPTQAGSRAVAYADGKPYEYAVNNATLLVFKQAGNKEGDYTFVEAVKLSDGNSIAGTSNQGITTERQYTARLTNYSTATTDKDSYYGLVLLNNNYSISGQSGTKVALPKADQTFSNWNETTSGAGMIKSDDGYYMASAPGWTTAGQVPLTLTHIDPAKVKFTQSDANAAGPAATIHVERGLAKVSLSKTTGDAKTPTNYTSDNVQINGWALDVTNKTSYPVHNVDGLTTYADIWKSNGSNPTDGTASVERFVDGSNSVFKRVYWAKDPNYSLGADYITGTDAFTKCGTQFEMINTSKDSKTGAYSDKVNSTVTTPLYCLENTFDINNMTQGQTTRVVFKATYKPNGITEGTTFYKVGSKLYTLENLKSEVSDIIKNLFGKTAGTDYVLNLAAAGNNITSASGTYEITDANLEKKTSGAKAFTRAGDVVAATPNNVFTSEQIALINSNLKGGISTYLDGVCYYIGRIQHFGDSETPWKEGDPTYGGSDNNSKFLGRYGVVRNNWYELNVEGIAGPGEPIVPPVVPENPDDDNNHYINLSVKILAWAKRSQNIKL